MRAPRNAVSTLGETARPVRLRTADGVLLSASHLPCESGSTELAVVLAHGFGGAHTKPWQARVARRLSRYAGVVAFDFRGHGRSAGLSTLGDLEVLDVAAAVEAARDLGYDRVVTCGWSMGGSAVLRHAALHRRVDGVVTVSATSRWGVRDTVPMRRLHWLVERPAGRRVSRHVLRTRLVDAWAEVPESPVEVAPRIAPTPLLVVHGDRDAYFTLDHPRALVAAAGDTAELWLVPGFAHAESGATPELVDRIGAHLRVLVDRVPAV
ncbi:MAG TPA: alpha/beta fold hydrolase [Mycobacteriales bacterium]|nr:alpha/beta fold hydrolase [Mycobacteriales bacterium]